MARTITTILFGVLVTGLLTFFMLEFVGGYSLSNGLIQNQTLASAINAAEVNASNPNIFGIQGNLSQNISTQTANLRNPGNIFTQISGAIGSVASFIGAIGNITKAVILFAAAPLVGLGWNIGFAEIVIELIISIVVVMTILSAIMIFPL